MASAIKQKNTAVLSQEEIPATGFDSLDERIGIDAMLSFAKKLHATPGEKTFQHLHPNNLHLTYTKSGKGICRLNDKKILCTPGTVSVVYPNEMHSYEAFRDNPYTNYNLRIYVRGNIPYYLPRIIRLGSERKEIERIFEELIELFPREDTLVKRLHESSLMLLLFAKLFELTTPELNFVHSQITNDALSRVLSELQVPPFHFPGIRHLAGKCKMSPRSFTAHFRQLTGLPPQEFQIRAKMTYADSVLKNINMKVSEIAERCGFANSQNFLRAYKKFFGYSLKESKNNSLPNINIIS